MEVSHQWLTIVAGFMGAFGRDSRRLVIGAVSFAACHYEAPKRHTIDRTALAQLSSSAAWLHRDSSISPRFVYVVDGSCDISVQGLSFLLADSAKMRVTRVMYMPQTERDPNATLETVALECARRLGTLSSYVADRVSKLGSVRRPVLESAVVAGLDTGRFLRCTRSTEVQGLVIRHAELAQNIGVRDLPALIGTDTAWIGSRSLGKLSTPTRP
jgi:hypothetical protein